LGGIGDAFLTLGAGVGSRKFGKVRFVWSRTLYLRLRSPGLNMRLTESLAEKPSMLPCLLVSNHNKSMQYRP